MKHRVPPPLKGFLKKTSVAGLHTSQLIFHCVPLGEFVIVVAYLYVGG